MSLIIDFQFGTEPPKVQYPEMVTLPGILNTHVHPRDTAKEDDGRAEGLLPLWSKVYEDVCAMGNTTIPLTTSDRALSKGLQWRNLIPHDSAMKLHVGGLIHEGTDHNDVIDSYDTVEELVAWQYMKMFIRAASNAHGADVDDVQKVLHLIKKMSNTASFTFRKTPMVVAIHAERKLTEQGNRIYFLNREAASIDRDIGLIFREVPNARLVICHVKGKYAVDMIRHYRSKGFDIWGEICPQYTMWTTDDLFEGPDGGTACDTTKFCLPIFGTPEDRDAVRGAMLSGEDFWFFGTDDACHNWDPLQSKGVKLNNRGILIGGQTQHPVAVVSYVIEQFIQAGKRDLIPAFLSHNGRRAYDLPPATTTITFHLNPWVVPEQIDWIVETSQGLKQIRSKVAMAGMTSRYNIVQPTT